MDHDEAFDAIDELTQLDDALEASRSATIILFNHDPYCPISARAYEQMTAAPGPVRMIDVSRKRDVTSEISRRTGVRHESPQVIVLREGRAVWSASHHAITAEAVERATSAAD